MIGSDARGDWGELQVRLRSYVARRMASSADVDDVVQDVFLRMQRGLLGLQDGERFGGWVYRIAEHALADHLRKRSRHPLGDGREVDPLADTTDPGADDRALESDLTACVALFVSRLASPYREAITLTELEGMTQKDGAEMLGLSLSGMKSRVQRGREQLRRMFEHCCEISVDVRGHVLDCTPRPLDQIPEDCRAAAECWASHRPQR